MFRLRIACVMCAAAAGAYSAELTEASCSVIASKKGEKPGLHDVRGLSVLSLRPDHPLTIKAPSDVTIHGIACWRSEARLAGNDYLVTDAGFSLYIKTELEDASRNRTLVLEKVGGGFRARLVEGPELSADEKDELQQFLTLYEARVQDRVATPGDLSRLSPDAPPDQPFVMNAAQRKAYEEAIAPYIAKARETWPEAKRRYLAGLPPRHIFFVTTRLHDAEGRSETAFIRVQSIKDGVVSGLISTQLELIRTPKMGDSYSFREEDLVDWMIANPDGSEEGNVVGKFLDTYLR